MKRKAFTLLEVLIACSFLSVFMIYFSLLVSGILKGSAKSAEKTTALLQAESLLESLRAVPFADVKSGSGFTVTSMRPDLKAIETDFKGIRLFDIRSRY